MKKNRVRKMTPLRLLLLLPGFWVTVIIAILAGASMFISIKLNQIEKAFASSVFSNLFAGLTTGFVLSLMSGFKAVHCAYLEGRYNWLKETHEMILVFINKHHQLYSISTPTNEDYSNLAYDALCCANDVNAHILHAQSDRAHWFNPNNYFLKTYEYDTLKTSDIMFEFRDYLASTDYNIENRRAIVDGFKSIHNTMVNLNKDILEDMRIINIRIISAKKTPI